MLSWEYPPIVYGGLGRHVHALAHALATAGHEVQVLSQGPPGVSRAHGTPLVATVHGRRQDSLTRRACRGPDAFRRPGRPASPPRLDGDLLAPEAPPRPPARPAP